VSRFKGLGFRVKGVGVTDPRASQRSIFESRRMKKRKTSETRRKTTSRTNSLAFTRKGTKMATIAKTRPAMMSDEPGGRG
jgi:hypothetical protein